MNLAAINWRSPITWVVIIGGGVAVYFLFRYFQGQNAANAAAQSAPSVPAVGTSLFLEAPPDTLSTTPTTTPTTPSPVSALTATYASVQSEAKAENSSLAKELQDKINQGYTITNVPAGVTLPGKSAASTGTDVDKDKTAATSGTSDKDNDRATKGGGVPDTSNWVHVSTWPYGGQRVTTRLG